jgi:hypothetical protein
LSGGARSHELGELPAPASIVRHSLRLALRTGKKSRVDRAKDRDKKKAHGLVQLWLQPASFRLPSAAELSGPGDAHVDRECVSPPGHLWRWRVSRGATRRRSPLARMPIRFPHPPPDKCHLNGCVLCENLHVSAQDGLGGARSVRRLVARGHTQPHEGHWRSVCDTGRARPARTCRSLRFASIVEITSESNTSTALRSGILRAFRTLSDLRKCLLTTTWGGPDQGTTAVEQQNQEHKGSGEHDDAKPAADETSKADPRRRWAVAVTAHALTRALAHKHTNTHADTHSAICNSRLALIRTCLCCILKYITNLFV